MTVPVYCGELAKVFKGTYQGRPVAVKVLQSYVTNRDVTVRVSPIVALDPAGLFSDPRPRNSAKRR